jgi:dUTP pyrophosphatase
MSNVVLKIKKINEKASLPQYKTTGASGFDLSACIDKDLILNPGDIKLIPTGLIFEIPNGYEIQIRPRSGLALKYGITLVNTPGTIDSDYRGEVKLITTNVSKEPFTVKNGERIAQAILTNYVRAEITEDKVLSETERGTGGFGHTGR